MKMSLAACVLLACASFDPALAAAWSAQQAPWPDAPYAQINRDERLSAVLGQFARGFGLRIEIEGDVDALGPAASGRMTGVSPSAFLDSLCAAHGLLWYHHQGVLHVSRRSDMTRRALPTRGLSGTSVRRILEEMGVFDARFGWSDIPERASVMVIGPRSYVDRVADTLAALPEEAVDHRVMVYRLRHASVEDRKMQFRDQSIISPGVASILRSLLSDDRTAGLSSRTEVGELAAPLASGLKSLRPFAQDTDPLKMLADAVTQSDRSGASRPPEAGSARRSAGPLIQSDPRLNAILIKDRPGLEPVYRQLIDLLDVPSHLVAIEAMIVDVSASSLSELGVDWSMTRNGSSVTFGLPGAAAQAGTIGLARQGATTLLARIQWLEGRGAARVVAQPSILTQDHMGALIDLSDTFYIQTAGERVATVTPVSAGVSLRVTPHIVPGDSPTSIQLVVDIEDGNIVYDSPVGSLPTVRRSVIGTQARIVENQSLLIGGFNTNTSRQERQQVPVLGDLPVFGALFGRTTTEDKRTERMFVITPRVVARSGPDGRWITDPPQPAVTP
ncbi:type III secretion system outer membrane ring subunit SctC [uncultured Hydrogenophaga sp.]|uniref:type III secretion system outer membrane ring subunit SctC n=1 Tax=uncultured Hydrogenophaga sp. TaxID=199683 RepID=UPI00265DC5CF|nr:type III secretion system outer membrane ring subunit SctC [uncultured Hydrogenophaga sp.]